MNPAAAEWIKFADSDYGAAQREFALPDGPNVPAVCFHAQQCIEKLLKAALISHRAGFPKTHDLTLLSILLRAQVPTWNPQQADLDILEPGAVLYRWYPGGFAGAQDAKDALAACERVRADLLRFL